MLKKALTTLALVGILSSAALADDVNITFTGSGSQNVAVTASMITVGFVPVAFSLNPPSSATSFSMGDAALSTGMILDSATVNGVLNFGAMTLTPVGTGGGPLPSAGPFLPGSLTVVASPGFEFITTSAGGFSTTGPDLIAGGLGSAIQSGAAINLTGTMLWNFSPQVLFPGVNWQTFFFGNYALDYSYTATLDLQFHAPAAAVPEPTSILLLGTGLVGLVLARRRTSRRT